MAQAYKMAVDALGLAIVSRKENQEEIPEATEIDKIDPGDGRSCDRRI